MALGGRLELRQGQGLAIPPQLQQAIKLLQLSNMELEAYVEGELERNPLLQRDERDSEPDREEAPREPENFAADQIPDGGAEPHMDIAHDQVSPGEQATGDAHEAQQAGGAIDWSKAGKGGSFEDTDDFEARLTREKTLSEHLHDQLSVAGLSPAQNAIAATLIDSVDEGGYLRCDLPEIAERLGFSAELDLATEYMSKGRSRSDGRPHAGLTLERSSGAVYVGAWAGTVTATSGVPLCLTIMPTSAQTITAV